MKFLKQMERRVAKCGCVFLVSLLFVLVPLSQNLSINKALAQWAVIDAANLQVNSLNLVANETTAAALSALVEKEYYFDGGLGWAIINMVLEQIVRDLTDWVRGGFREGPAFVTDFDNYLLKTADTAAGEFLLADGPLEFLCSPFKLDITYALRAQYLDRGAYYKPECSITETFDNIEGFLAGDFYAGGWDAWASLTLNPRNNVYGAIFEAQSELSAAIVGAQQQEVAYLDFGGGFFGVEECDENGDCQRVTPGSIIQDGLSNTLNIGNERLTVADEIDELVAALLAHLMSSVFSSGGGLAEFSVSGDSTAYDPIQTAGQQVLDQAIEDFQNNLPDPSDPSDPGDPGNSPGDVDDPIPGPDCFDGIQNQDETGVDTGGRCEFVLPPPTLTAEAGFCGGIIVQWGGVSYPGADIYDLRDNGTQAYSGFATWFPHSNLDPGSNHSYIVRAVPTFYFPTGSDWSSPPVVESAPRACTQEETDTCLSACQDEGLPNCSDRCSVLTTDSPN